MNGLGETATGIVLPQFPTATPGPYIVAVDPTVIPLGSELKIWPNPFGNPSIVFSAQDTGGAIKGDRIDFLDMQGRASQDSWGVRPVQVSVIGQGTAGVLPNASTTPQASLYPSSTSTTSTSPSSSGTVPSSSSPEWAKLTLSAALLGLGIAFARKGVRSSLSSRKAA